jgi:hypothetical protein
MDPENPDLTPGRLFSHREALLYKAFQAACDRYCCLRQDGECDLTCPGRMFGQTTGLIPIQAYDEPGPNPDQPSDEPAPDLTHDDPCNWLPKPFALRAKRQVET